MFESLEEVILMPWHLLLLRLQTYGPVILFLIPTPFSLILWDRRCEDALLPFSTPDAHKEHSFCLSCLHLYSVSSQLCRYPLVGHLPGQTCHQSTLNKNT
ncbi:unnamed protein product [Protopolystoma xenopodis]|uniref:Uncharacterized protein n=1 Tax=Protopolystoma xenopodis TaxID=117903 RepID=A0A448WJP8_9PLAT|nr:unnamed protein product [Protopolystoma xenopodis]